MKINTVARQSHSGKMKKRSLLSQENVPTGHTFWKSVKSLQSDGTFGLECKEEPQELRNSKSVIWIL